MQKEKESVYVGASSGHNSRVFVYDISENGVEELLEEYEREQDENLLALAVEEVAAEGEELGDPSGYAWGYRGAGPENLAEDIESREHDMDEEWLEGIIRSFEPDESWVIWPSMSSEGLGPDYRSNSGFQSTPP